MRFASNHDQVFAFTPMPADLQFGFGIIDTLPAQVRKLGGTKAYIVTDAGLRKAGVIDRIEAILKAGGVASTVYDKVVGDSGTNLIMEAAGEARRVGAEVVIGIGGGSSLDTSKAVAMMAKLPGHITDYAGLDKVPEDPLPIINVPTAAGTGSEVSIWSVFTNDANGVKIASGSVRLIPKVVLADPELTVGLPPALTASTGMDALGHAVECYVNKACQPISGALALEAIQLIGKHLRTAVHDGKNRAARYGMLLASTMAGIAMNPTRLGLAHALAMPLGSWDLHIHHGTIIAITLPEVMEFNHSAAPERYAAVAEALGEDVHGLDPLKAAAKSVSAVRRLKQDVGITKGLGELGLREDKVALVVDEAMKSGNVTVNPRATSRADMEAILRASM
jgi:alcohol dehydrogenase class IV